MNLGKIDYVSKTYIKYVNFSKAVLWKDRQLSLPLPVISTIEKAGIEKIIFIDNNKNEKWMFDTKDVLQRGLQKSVGQEPQWYFPIELATKSIVKETFM